MTNGLQASGKRPLRLCFVETADSAFLTHRLPVGVAAQRRGMEVHVIAPGGDRDGRLQRGGFHYHALAMDRAGVNPLDEARVIRELAQIYRKIAPDIVHHVALKSILDGALAAKLAGVSTVVGSLIGLGYTFLPGGPKRFVMREVVCMGLRLGLRGTQFHTIFQNPDDRHEFVRRGIAKPANTSLIFGSGVDIERFQPQPERAGTPVVLMGARMLWDKGLKELTTAARLLRSRGVDFELRLAGVPDFANPTAVSEAQLRAWQDEGLVKWLGHVSDMPEQFAQAHVVCLPSFTEGLPLFLAEAAAAGRPAVSTDVPGSNVIVKHGETGLLVPPRDADALANGLHALLADPACRARMGSAARCVAVASFSREKVVADTLALYESLLARRSRG